MTNFINHIYDLKADFESYF